MYSDLPSNLNASRQLTLALYILYVLAIFSAGILAVIALVINYVKFDSVRGTWLESHFHWQIRSFWWYLLWNVLAFAPFLLLFAGGDSPERWAGLGLLAIGLCGLVVFLAWVWIVYRAIRGLVALNDQKALY